MTNQQVIEKAVVTTDALAAAGKLNPEQADKFIDYVFDETGLKNNARMVRFRAEQYHVDKMDVGQRVMVRAGEAASPAVRRGVTHSRVTLQPVEVMVPFEIGQTYAEQNIEGEDIYDKVIKMMARRFGNNLETLYLEGDQLGRAALESDMLEGGSTTLHVRDTTLDLIQGWFRLADGGNVVDAGGQNIGSNLLSRALNALPARFKRDKSKLRFLTSLDLEQLLRERISSRATPAGDDALQSIKPLTPFGIPAVPYPLWPFRYRAVEHITLAGTTAVALRRANVANVVVHLDTLAGNPTAPFVAGTDYDVDLVAGTVTRRAGGAIADPTVVKVTYDEPPCLILTHHENFIVGVGRDVSIGKDEDIFRRTKQYAIHARVAAAFEEVTALVKVVNIGLG